MVAFKLENKVAIPHHHLDCLFSISSKANGSGSGSGSRSRLGKWDWSLVIGSIRSVQCNKSVGYFVNQKVWISDSLEIIFEFVTKTHNILEHLFKLVDTFFHIIDLPISPSMFSSFPLHFVIFQLESLQNMNDGLHLSIIRRSCFCKWGITKTILNIDAFWESSKQ